MTVEQKKDLEDMLHFYSWNSASCEAQTKIESVFIHDDWIMQIQEVLEVLGYEVNKEEKKLLNGTHCLVYTITPKP